MFSDDAKKALGHILGAIDYIDSWVISAGSLNQAVYQNELYFSAIVRQFLIVSEASIRIERWHPGELTRRAPEIDWRGVRGFGNVIRHRYDDMDKMFVAKAIQEDLPPLQATCRRLLSET